MCTWIKPENLRFDEIGVWTISGGARPLLIILTAVHVAGKHNNTGNSQSANIVRSVVKAEIQWLLYKIKSVTSKVSSASREEKKTKCVSQSHNNKNYY